MGRFWPLVSKHFFLPIFVSFEFKTPHLHHGKTMDPLEFHAKYNRLERKHRRVEKELAELKAEMEKNRAAPTPPADFYSPPPKPAQGRRVFGLCLDCDLPCNSPATGVPETPPPTAGDFWVAWEANRSRHDKAEETRRKQEDRNRQKAVFLACGWDKSTASPVLVRAATGLWKGTETTASRERDTTWRGKKRYVYIYMRVCNCIYVRAARVHPFSHACCITHAGAQLPAQMKRQKRRNAGRRNSAHAH